MRKKYYADENGHWIEERPKHESSGVMIMTDINPYQSMITGETISSRSKHREHLREHGCYEVGNDFKQHLTYYDNLPDVAPQQRHEIIRAQVNAMRDEDFKKALKKDIDRVKWTRS